MSAGGRQSSLEDMGSSILNKLPVSSSRRQKVMGYLKAKRDEYISGGGGNSDVPEDDFSPAARELQGQAMQLNEPFPDEKLLLYQSYSRHLDEGGYEVEVRGWLHLPGLPNRKSRIIHSLARQIAGVGSTNQAPAAPSNTMPGGYVDTSIQPQPRPQRSTTDSLIELEEDDDEDELRVLAEEVEKEKQMDREKQKQRPQPPPSLSRTSTTSSLASVSSTNGQIDEEARLKDRLSPFMARPAPCRRLQVQIGASSQTTSELKSVHVTTLPSGRFSARIRVDYEPSIVHVTASDEVIATEEIMDISPTGVSVITDIDDTIKKTGITGEKRELFRNVFIRDYDKVGVDGVPQWFQQLSQRGVHFHYVSNSPWQLYSSVEDFLKIQGLPPGSVHLKQYSGFMNGLFEPASERKRTSLYRIFQDFPHRKFILVGDSGEGDLEAYLDIAIQFPKQVLAIYLRDVTLPLDDKTFHDNDMNEFLSQTGYIPKPDEITAYDDLSSNKRRGGQWKSRSTMSLKPPIGTRSGVSPSPPPPPPPRATTVSQPNLIDLSDEDEKKPPVPPSRPTPTATKKPKPPVPRKPVGLRSTSVTKPPTQITPPTDNYNPYKTPPSPPNSTENEPSNTPPPLPPRKNASKPQAPNENPIYMSSSQNDYGQYEVLDKKIENWKARVTRARCELPPGVRLRMWRKAQDVAQESLVVTDSTNSS
ncbi:hypothetical protein TRICI_005597 [Trichomonascus ciferrii]|uniref:Phosphatidate phosphatase APP1 catalytic domain-containing protein n=1 Tax=Trichomonascus ciferrii TaxID=44093 RepID=A0A642US40_9ASCO|nr:hypothetical protein TRICI_005597 [Trichomonascus ciferrii]